MKRQATQIAVPIVGAEGLDIKKLTSEYEASTKELNERLGSGWRIFATHTVSNNLTTYLVYVLTKIELESKDFEVEV